MKSVPPLNDLFQQAGMSLPDMLGKTVASAAPVAPEEKPVHKEG